MAIIDSILKNHKYVYKRKYHKETYFYFGDIKPSATIMYYTLGIRVFMYYADDIGDITTKHDIFFDSVEYVPIDKLL